MQGWSACRWMTLLVLVVAASACGALLRKQAPKAKEAPAAPSDGEPDFTMNSFGVLRQATPRIDLPYLASANGAQSEMTCYQLAQGLEPWDTERASTLAKIEEFELTIRQAIVSWAADELLPPETDPAVAAGLSVEFEKPTVVHTPMNKVRLDPKNECIDQWTGTLAPDARTITTLFGARVFKFKTSEPLSANRARKMRRRGREKGIQVVTVDPYTPALDDNGEQVRDEKNRKLFNSPSGELIRGKKVPEPKFRSTVEWTAQAEEPIWFAFGDMPADVWRREEDPTKCKVNLVFDDPVPRQVDCKELEEAGFGVSAGQSEGQVLVKVVSDGVSATAETAYGEAVRIQAGGRVIAWVTPEKLIEGAVVTVDSLVLDPGPCEAGALDSFVTEVPSGAIQDQEEEPGEKKKKKKRRRKKKKKKKN